MAKAKFERVKPGSNDKVSGPEGEGGLSGV
jgi:hypothetical protein